MKEISLHRVLWGICIETGPPSEWPIRPWEIPAVGLPARIAVSLFRSAQSIMPPLGWDTTRGPLTWVFQRGVELLATGRRHQFDLVLEESTDVGQVELEVGRSLNWEVTPHAAYYLPLLAGTPVHDESFTAYSDVLLLLTAIDGGESILDALVEHGAGAVPFEDQWGWRSRIHLPKEAWRLIKQTLRWAENPAEDVLPIAASLALALEPWTPEKASIDDFVLERVDVLLDAKDEDEGARTVRTAHSHDSELPKALLLQDSQLCKELLVRIGQVRAWTPTAGVVANFPAMDPGSVPDIMQQVAYAFRSPSHSVPDHKPDLVLLPEVSIPQPEVRTVRNLVASTGRAALAGLYWRELRPVYRACNGTVAVRKWFVN